MYDEINYITHTFYKELNKKLQIYSLKSTSAVGIQGIVHLVRPESSLKLNVVNSKYMDHTVLQQEDIRKPGKIETKGTKVTNFSILSTKPKRRIGSPAKMPYQIIDEIKIVRLENCNLKEKLNPVKIMIHDSEIQSKLLKHGNQSYKYRFIVNSLLISS